MPPVVPPPPPERRPELGRGVLLDGPVRDRGPDAVVRVSALPQQRTPAGDGTTHRPVPWAPTATPTPVRGVPHPFGPVRPRVDPPADEPPPDEPGADEPSADDPAADEPGADEPSADDPAADQPSVDDPTSDEPGADDPTAVEPAAERPTPADAAPADRARAVPSAPPDPVPWSLVARRERPRVYVDGSALSRYLVGAPSRDPWLAWVADHEDRLVTTFLGVSELRRVARPRGVEAHGVAHDVTGRVEVVRFSDQSLHAAARVANVLPSFVALHVGAAVAHPQVGAVATYDVQLAQVAALHGLGVVSPGWPAGWWERARPPA
ncbi:hypothetical protein OMK64_14245 [Cellulomonas fimi]|uniref:PIN domain-containing protein n=1 Tax=Cellulomonas fimi TaxID=1708 RepID=UPI00234DD3CB|nr:PIN domain-containing protein [Cellulomonas fimi]MDC7122694.1 hypothetical protein [Cellulomonas fimi]